MKITKSQLKQIIQEELEDTLRNAAAKKLADAGKKAQARIAADRARQKDRKRNPQDKFGDITKESMLSEDGHEDTSSARRAMQTIIEDATDMLQHLDDMDGTLPTWWTNKMAVAANNLNKMRDYLLVDADEKAAAEILSTRMGSYAGTTLPGGKKIAPVGGTQKQGKPRLEPWME